MARVAAVSLVVSLSVAIAAYAAPPPSHKPDLHLHDSAAALYQRSPFAHGYIHGYEDGFHIGDQDVQFGRVVRGIQRKKPRSHPESTVPTADPASFRKGYDQGFGAGYRDSIAGREFRAILALREAAAALPSQPSPATDDHAFDAAFRDGYFAGESYAAKTSKPLTDFSYISSYCASQKNHQKDPASAHCPAYTQGFRIGYADARIQRPAQTTASTK